jgi:hypothetical protein
MTVDEEIKAFILDMKRRRVAAGENPNIVVGESAAALLVFAHFLALKIGLTRQEIVDHLDTIILTAKTYGKPDKSAN